MKSLNINIQYNKKIEQLLNINEIGISFLESFQYSEKKIDNTGLNWKTNKQSKK